MRTAWLWLLGTYLVIALIYGYEAALSDTPLGGYIGAGMPAFLTLMGFGIGRNYERSRA